MTTQQDAPVIAAQYNGPNRSGNGGYVAGLVGERLRSRLGADVAVSTTLRVPPPLERPLRWVDGDEATALMDGEVLIAEARAADFGGHPPVAPVTRSEATDAMAAYEGYVDHPFPNCFGCGSARTRGDGLLVFPGPVGDGRTACPWTTEPEFGDSDDLLGPPIMWAVLDCPGGWAADIKRKPMVLGRMTATLLRRPVVGEPCVVVASLREVSGRKNLTATTLYGADDEILGRAEQVWITIDVAAFS